MTTQVLQYAIGDVCINLSAGWFGLTMIAPNFIKKRGVTRMLILTFDVVLGTVFLLLGVGFRSL